MIEEQLFEKYRNLSLNDKRNELNQELIKIFELISALTKNKSYDLNNSNLLNYNTNSDKKITEGQYLQGTYQNVINIRKILMNYIAENE